MPQNNTREAYDIWHREHGTLEPDDDPLRFPWYESVFREVAEFQPQRILEVGCGRGEFAIFLRRQFPDADIAGIDFSEAAIQIAAERSEKGEANVNFIRADAENLPFDDETYDLVISCECMEHVHDPEKMARELSRIARLGAKICLTTENYLNGMMVARFHSWLIGRPFNSGSGVQPRENLIFFWNVKRWLEKAGLSVERMESCHYQWLLLPGIAPSRLCTNQFRKRWLRRFAKPFGRHFSFFARKVFPSNAA